MLSSSDEEDMYDKIKQINKFCSSGFANYLNGDNFKQIIYGQLGSYANSQSYKQIIAESTATILSHSEKYNEAVSAFVEQTNTLTEMLSSITSKVTVDVNSAIQPLITKVDEQLKQFKAAVLTKDLQDQLTALSSSISKNKESVDNVTLKFSEFSGKVADKQAEFLSTVASTTEALGKTAATFSDQTTAKLEALFMDAQKQLGGMLQASADVQTTLQALNNKLAEVRRYTDILQGVEDTLNSTAKNLKDNYKRMDAFLPFFTEYFDYVREKINKETKMINVENAKAVAETSKAITGAVKDVVDIIPKPQPEPTSRFDG